MNISKSIEYSESMRINHPINIKSANMRQKRYGCAINDADYVTQPYINGIKEVCPAYQTWVNMLKRCLDANRKAVQPTYKDVIVCEEWLLFSNFRAWWINNYTEGYHLDKDLLVKGNQLYSPETCVYVPRWLNAFTTNRAACRGKYKVGVDYNKKSGKFQSRCWNPKVGKREQLGLFMTENDAYSSWLSRKLEIALELKSEMDLINMKIYPNVVEIIKCS